MKTGSKRCLLESHMFLLGVDLMTLFFIRHESIDLDLYLVKMNMLTKFHEDCIKTVPSKVYICFLRFDLVT